MVSVESVMNSYESYKIIRSRLCGSNFVILVRVFTRVKINSPCGPGERVGELVYSRSW